MNIKQYTRDSEDTTDVVWRHKKTGTYYVIVLLSAARRQNAFCNDIEPLYVRSTCCFSRYMFVRVDSLHSVRISLLLYLLLLCINTLSSYFSSVLVAQGL